MTSRHWAITLMAIATVFGTSTAGRSQSKAGSWLDQPKPTSWNKPGAALPAAPKLQSPVDPRCRESARPPQFEQDKRLHEQGWDLVGAYQGGWQMLVIGGTAGYDGMCRPRQYQYFVFVGGVYAGTLSPRPMDSRTDGALDRVFLQGSGRLTAEYARYGEKDALCCPSRTTHVEFSMATDRVLQPVSASTSKR